MQKHSREELPYARGQGQWPGAAAGRTNPHVQGAVAARAQEGLEELSNFDVKKGGGWEEQLHI